MKKFFTFLILCAVAALTAGCASSRISQFYTLSPSAISPATQKAGYGLSVGPVSIPAVVDRPQIVLQKGPNQVYISEFDRWAAPLTQEIARIMAENLAGKLGVSQVTLFPQMAAEDSSYRVVIDILRFDSTLNHSAILDARWTVTSPEGNKTQNGRIKITETVQGGGMADLVAAHSLALEKLSQTIAQGIQTIESGSH